MADSNRPRGECQHGQLARQCELCEKDATIAEQAATIARLEGERDGWERTAADMANGMAFYRDIVRQAGQHFGPAVYTSDDGSVQDEVLAPKVPELAAAVVAERDEAVQEFEVMNARLGEVIIAKAQAEAERDALRARVAELEARDIPDAMLDELVGWAFRYGLGRQSYAVGMIAEAVRTYRQRLLPQTRARLMREIEEAIQRGEAGMACDVREWEAVHAALQEEPQP